MRVLAFSDLHRDKDAARTIVAASVEADVVIGAGDFATKREGLMDTLDILRNSPAPMIFVHGNHDDADAVEAACKAQDHWHYLQGNECAIGDQVFFGIGGEVPATNDANWNTSMSEDGAMRLMRECPVGSVLISHSPPFGVVDAQKDGRNDGSKAVHRGIQDWLPKLVLCGHIHSAWGQHGMVGETPVHNLGPTVNWFDV
jgi:Icc-related predicted phosphoesterase